MMAEQRAVRGNERRGFAIAVAAHVLIIGLLSFQWTPGDRRFDNPPMEVDLIAETAVQSTAPVISETPPAARLGEEDNVDIAAPEPMPAPPLPEPVVRPPPAPTPKQVARPKAAPPKQPPAAQKAQPKAAPKAPPAKDRPTRPTGRLDGIAEGLSRSQPKSPASKGAPAAATAAEVRRSIDVSIKAKVGPRWNGCRISGVDVDQLKTVVKFKLTQSGALAGFTSVNTTGENDSNKFQVQRHQECAKRAVELAAPFDLPEENYSFWQNYTLDFIKR
jgi:outer membrane biosynthesis protein TonB